MISQSLLFSSLGPLPPSYTCQSVRQTLPKKLSTSVGQDSELGGEFHRRLNMGGVKFRITSLERVRACDLNRSSCSNVDIST